MDTKTKNCQNCKKIFNTETEDLVFYEKFSSSAKYKIPTPSWCPDCRFQRRCLFRNERKLFKNIDGETGKNIISVFPKEAKFPVYEDSYWFSDKWDPFSYGINFDRSRSFLSQFYDLMIKVPHPRSNSVNMVNSDYCANVANLKNCYLIFNATFSEDSAYGNAVDYCKDCFDNSYLNLSEKCYQSFRLNKCFETHFSSSCEECVSIYFSKNCIGCSNCFGCVNLINKSYCFFNQQLTKEEYFNKVNFLKISKWSNLKEVRRKVEIFWSNFPVRYMQGVKNQNCSGEYISNSKDVKDSYLIRGGENLKYVHYAQVPVLRDSMDMLAGGLNSELIYESATCGWNSSQIRFSYECWDGGVDFEYSMFCGKKANHIFGSIGMNSGEYIILNKKYLKEDFYKLRDEIRKHMDEMPYVDSKGRAYKYGEFFPPEFSPFAYDDTVAPEHFPLSKEEIIKYGARWYEVPQNEYDVSMKSEDLWEDIKDVPDEILNEIISCDKCKRAYKIIREELQFLRQNNLPIPRDCANCRHDERINQRNKSKLYKRKCCCNGDYSSNDKYKNTIEHLHGKNACTNEFETSHSPDSIEIVYCEKCYQQEVY